MHDYTRVEILVRDEVQLAAVYALLGGVSFAAISASAASVSKPSALVAEKIVEPVADAQETAHVDDGTVDAHGHPWSEALHASTKSTTKEGLWRMKPGVSRPDPLPGFPAEDTISTKETGTASKPESTVAASTATESEDEDEFAAFREATEKTKKVDEEAIAKVPARKWTDADLSALCNQAAMKLNDPKPVRDVVAEFVPEGEVAHSRNIQAEHREAFAQKLEKVAEIEYGA